MRVYINRRPVDGPWGGGNLFVRSFCDLAENFGVNVAPELSGKIDGILMVEPRDDGLGPAFEELAAFKRANPKTLLFHRVNECDARKNTDFMDALLQRCSEVTDATIFVSNWMMNYHVAKGWRCARNFVRYNGVDRRIFAPQKKIGDGRIHLVTHHWSNNPLKGFDVYEEIDRWLPHNPQYTFTYIGRERSTFSNTRVVGPLFGEALGRELGRYDVAISASRFDPGPNHVLETISCRIPTFVHADGGGAVEFAGQSFAYRTFSDLEQKLRREEFSMNAFAGLSDWEHCIRGYCEILLQTWKESTTATNP
jgi:hypothetical protein